MNFPEFTDMNRLRRANVPESTYVVEFKFPCKKILFTTREYINATFNVIAKIAHFQTAITLRFYGVNSCFIVLI